MRFRICIALLSCLSFSATSKAQKTAVSEEGQQCLACHSSTTPGLVEQWQSSAHAKKAVDCYSCHQAAANDPAAFDHYGLKIAVIVTPNTTLSDVRAFPTASYVSDTNFAVTLDTEQTVGGSRTTTDMSFSLVVLR